MRKNILRSSLIIAVLAVSLTLAGCNAKLFSGAKKITPQQAITIAEKYINDNLMSSGSKAKIDSVTEENNLYKLSVNIGQGQDIDSYISEDGTKFFPEALDIKPASSTPAAADNSANTGNAAAATMTKSDKPKVELFVMSYCPYGTQMEKGIIPAVEALGSKIDYTLKFVDYSMHGDKELKENMVQYCIETEQNAKFDTYLKCFLEASDSAGCLTKAGVNTTKVDACVAATDKKYSVMAKTDMKGSYPAFNVYKDDNAKYNVGGSPTLIINGVESQSNRDSASLLKGICSAFNTAPKECDTKLSSTAPSAGFGSAADTTGGSNTAGCATN